MLMAPSFSKMMVISYQAVSFKDVILFPHMAARKSNSRFQLIHPNLYTLLWNCHPNLHCYGTNKYKHGKNITSPNFCHFSPPPSWVSHKEFRTRNVTQDM